MRLPKIMLFAVCMWLAIVPVMGATNDYTLLRTTTSELSNGAWSQEATITGDQIRFTGDQTGRYISSVFSVPNLVYGDVSYSMDDPTNSLEYAWLYSNNQWINSTDQRHSFNGHAYYSICYPFTDDAINGYTTDSWYVSPDSITDLYLYNGAYIWGSGQDSCLKTDGVNDYARASYSFNYDTFYTFATMVQPASAGTIFSTSSGSTVANMELKYVESTTDYLKLRIVDSSNNIVEYYDSSKSVNINEWHYVVIYCDSTNIYLYCDGVLQCSGLYDIGAGNMNMDYITLGGIWFSGSIQNNCDCYIDEFRFHQGGVSSLGSSLASSSSPMGLYMWNEVYDVPNPIEPYYKLSGAGSIYIVIYSSYDNPLSPEYNYVYDISTTLLNTAPTYSAASPISGDVAQNPILSVTANDADITYNPIISATFYVDGSSIGTSSRSGDGTITKSSSFVGGEHEWYAIVYDPWGGSVLTNTYHFNVPATLYIRDESDPDNLINASVKVSFYTENMSITRTTSNGTISLAGLPVTNLLVSATADGYVDRKTIISSLYDTSSIYLINETQSLIYNSFSLNDQTADYPLTEYIIYVQKPMNGTVETVFSSYFDFDGKCGTYLISSDVYRLVILAPDGSQTSYGWLYPDSDGTIEIVLQSVQLTKLYDDWLKLQYSTDSDAKTISVDYDSNETISEAIASVSSDGVELYNVTSTANSGIFAYVAPDDGSYTTSLRITTEAGKVYSQSWVVSFGDGDLQIVPDSYPQWFTELIVISIIIVLMLAFSSYRADVGCGSAALMFAAAYKFGWINTSPIIVSLVAIIAFAAVLKFKRKQDRVI